MFATNQKWLEEFCSKLIDKNINIHWECNGRIGATCIEALPLMKEAGCVNIGHGFESGSNKMLKSMNKQATVEQAKETIEAVRDARLETSGAFIIGSPGETSETIQETVDFIKETELPVAWFGFMTPYPGTQIYKDSIQKGLITDEIDFHRKVWNTQNLLINLTDMTDKELIELKEKGIENIYYYLTGLTKPEIIESALIGKNSTRITIKCRNCNYVTSQTYTIVDMQNNVLICENCYRKKLVHPVHITHMKKMVESFIKRMREVGNKKVLVCPVGEHTKRIIIDTMPFLNNWDNVEGFLDGDTAKIKHGFMDMPVFLRTKSEIERLNPDYIVVTAHIGLKDRIVKDLLSCGYPKRQIIAFGGL